MTRTNTINAARFGPLSCIAICLFLSTFASGCDLPDPSAFLPPTQDIATVPATGEADTAPAEPKSARFAKPAARAPGMESIGPEDSQRVYYQFVDDRGRVQFVERLSEVPAAWRDRVGYVEMNQPPPLTPVEARKSWQLSDGETAKILLASTGPARLARAGGRQVEDVVLYSADWCGYCTKARAHLDREGVDYELRDVDIQANAEELKQKTGRGGIPVLDYSGQILRGYRADQYEQAIDSIRG